MIKEAKSEEDDKNNSEENTGIKNLFFLGIATSIDALAVGFTFSLTKIINIYFPALIIGIVTFFIAGSGVIIGNKFGTLLGNKAQYLGGIILILIAAKTLITNFI